MLNDDGGGLAMTTVKTISLWQPWATLLLLETDMYLDSIFPHRIKPHETRTWATAHRGLIAIHAAKRILKAEAQRALDDDIIGPALREIGIRAVADFPLGAVVGTGILRVIHRTEHVSGLLHPLQIACGDYSAGRFAWAIISPGFLAQPIPAKGQQGLWSWVLPEGLKLS